MRNKQIKNILEDIYKIDDSLRVRGPQLEKIVAEILEAKPEVSIDEKFKKELYLKLMERVSEFKQKEATRINIWQRMFGRKLSYSLVGAVITVLIVVGIGYVANQNGVLVFKTKTLETAFEFSKVALNDNAFGSLKSEEQPQAALEGRGNEAGSGGGGGSGTSGSGTAVMPDQTVACAGQAGCVVPPYYFPEYVYTGEDVKLEQTRVEVLRRKNRMEPLGILESFGLGLVDLSVFKDAKIQTVNFVQDKEYGYNVSINFEEGTISVDAYWPRWPQLYNKCADDRCIEENRIKFSDIPSDEELIRIANQFIAEHGISLKSYGQPEEENDWRNQPGILETQIYVPDSIFLIYPLLIDGKSVYEQSGIKLGIRVGINIREKRVSGMYNLSLQEYESSMYDAETDFSRILEFAEKGGVNRYYWNEGQTKKVEIGTPVQEYMVEWRYDQNNRMNKMLIIPALIFPITKTPVEGYYYQKNIIVPLAKELLEENENPPYPVPLLEGQ